MQCYSEMEYGKMGMKMVADSLHGYFGVETIDDRMQRKFKFTVYRAKLNLMCQSQHSKGVETGQSVCDSVCKSSDG